MDAIQAVCEPRIQHHSARLDGANRTLLFSDLPNYSHILLLQGPVGPFFKNLGRYWRNRGASVTKVNFNSGDDLFYSPLDDVTIQYQSRLEFWPQYLSDLLIEKSIRAVFLFGDCRQMHRPVRALCESFGIDLWVFEEGYIRPNFFTLEKKGVNHSSNISNLDIDAICLSKEAQDEAPIKYRFNKSYWYMVVWATQYWFKSFINQSHYPDYTHHRVLDLKMGMNWTKSFIRYHLYRISEKSIKIKLLRQKDGKSSDRLFLLPLQVHDDAQIVYHSDFESIEQLLETVISSFAKHIKSSGLIDSLVIKHHPMDRGNKNFRNQIAALASLYKIKESVIYVHDISIPNLLKNISGCVTVNSTIGLQALYHRVPVICLGRSFYDKPGLTFQGTLEEFWSSVNQVDTKTVKCFRNYLLHHVQVNGCLYDPSYRIN